MQDVFTWVVTLSLGVGLAACAGFRAWLPLLLTGLLARFEIVQLHESFAFLSSAPALVLFGIATVVEIGADKVPMLDHGLDTISTFIRPAAGALLAAAALYDAPDPLFASVVGLMVGAPTALVPHAAKSAARAASTTMTAGLANPMISVAEDVAALALFIVAIMVPVILVAGLFVVLLLLLRWRSKRARSKPDAAPEPA